MAENKKKTAAKKAAGKGNASSKNKKPTEQDVRYKNQMRAVILFAVALFLGCLVIIKGESLWQLGHNFLLGFFGLWAILWPALLLYIAVVLSFEKTNSNFNARMGLVVLVILLVCGVGAAFGSNASPSDQSFWQILGNAFVAGVNRGTNSFIGGLISLPLIALCGSIGAKIILLLVLFVAVMALTGTTLVKLFNTMAVPVNAVSKGIRTVKEKRDEKNAQAAVRRVQKASSDIDIALDGPSVVSGYENVQSLFPKKEKAQSKMQPESVEKRNKLLQVFDAPAENTEEKIAEAPVEEIMDEVVNAAEPEEVVAETPSVAFEEESVPVVEKRPAEVPLKSAFSEPQDSDADAAKAVQEFMRSKKAEDKRESAVLPGQISIFENREEDPHYIFPPISMLEASKGLNDKLEAEELQTSGKMLVDTLKSFGVQTSIVNISRGPSVTRYELQPAPGVKISRITGLADDIAMNLAAVGVRIEAPIPGKAAVGIEVPNKAKTTVRMRDLIESNSFVTAKSKLTVALGRDIAGQVRVADLAKMPHLLIAGTTGSGKSVCINSMIVSLLYKASPDQVRFLMIDPKVVELGVYNDIPHLLTPVVTDPRKAAGALGWAVNEMLNRYRTFAEFNVRDIAGYNAFAAANNYQDENGQPLVKMAQIVIIIDELSDLMMAAPNEVEDSICRLAQMARAAGMHLIVATQRPSVDVVTGLIKANIPSRIAFAVSSAIDSRTILDTGGAEKLLGQGDMLFAPIGAQKPLRIQGCFVTDAEIESIATFVKTQHQSSYDEKVIEEIEKNASAAAGDSDGGDDEEGFNDDRLDDAIKCVIEAGQASTSLLQRRLRLGYARAGRLIDQMEQLGIVGPHEGSKPRQVLMTYQQYLERNMLKQDP